MCGTCVFVQWKSPCLETSNGFFLTISEISRGMGTADPITSTFRKCGRLIQLYYVILELLQGGPWRKFPTDEIWNEHNESPQAMASFRPRFIANGGGGEAVTCAVGNTARIITANFIEYWFSWREPNTFVYILSIVLPTLNICQEI
jgi:hypothetical protein